MPPRLTIVVSPPRCGSTWLYNAIRLVFRSAGYAVKPDEVSTDPQETMRIVDEAARDLDRRTVYVAKSHSPLSPCGDGVRAATILRDPRDMLVSFRAFPNAAQADADALEIVGVMIGLYDHIAQIWGRAAFWARYEDIVAQPSTVATAFRAATGLPAAPARDREIGTALQPETVREIVARAEAGEGASGPIGEKGGAPWGFDRRTGFQTGHIQDGATGKWRTGLSQEDCARIHGRFGDWLTARGFPLE